MCLDSCALEYNYPTIMAADIAGGHGVDSDKGEIYIKLSDAYKTKDHAIFGRHEKYVLTAIYVISGTTHQNRLHHAYGPAINGEIVLEHTHKQNDYNKVHVSFPLQAVSSPFVYASTQEASNLLNFSFGKDDVLNLNNLFTGAPYVYYNKASHSSNDHHIVHLETYPIKVDETLFDRINERATSPPETDMRDSLEGVKLNIHEEGAKKMSSKLINCKPVGKYTEKDTPESATSSHRNRNSQMLKLLYISSPFLITLGFVIIYLIWNFVIKEIIQLIKNQGANANSATSKSQSQASSMMIVFAAKIILPIWNAIKWVFNFMYRLIYKPKIINGIHLRDENGNLEYKMKGTSQMVFNFISIIGFTIVVILTIINFQSILQSFTFN